MTPKEFVGCVKELRFDHVFNPYSDRCAVHDVEDAPARRTRALSNLLEAAVRTDVEALWIGRDLGYRGGRRTGLALTDDVHLSVHATRWRLQIESPTIGAAVAERTAAVIWSMLAKVPEPVFLWNVFPLHPHEPGAPFSNRSHQRHERAAGEELLFELVAMLRPRRLIAIGNDASHVAGRQAIAEVVQVRHPSYGGQTQFIKQICCLYHLNVLAS